MKKKMVVKDDRIVKDDRDWTIEDMVADVMSELEPGKNKNKNKKNGERE